MLVSFSCSEQFFFEFFAVYPVPVLRDHKGYCYSRRDITNALTNSLSFSLVIYLECDRPMDLMVLAAFLHVSFMWCVSDRLLSKLTP